MKFGRVASLFGGSLLLVALRLGGAVFAFALNFILARAMSPNDMGIAMSYMSMAILGAVLVSLSVEAGCVRFITRYTETNELAKARGIVKFSRRIVLTLGPMLLILIAFGLWSWSGFVGADYPLVFFVMALCSVCMAWLRVSETHSLAFGAVVRSVLPTTLYRQFFLFAAVWAWYVAYGSIEVSTVLFLMLAGLVFSIVIQDIVNRKLYGAVGVGIDDYGVWREWIKVGMQLGVALLFVRYSRDIMLVVASFSLAPKDVAVLGIATALIGFAKFGVVAVNQNITPQLARAVSRNDDAAIKNILYVSNHMKFWPMIVVFIGLAVFGRPLLGLFGPAFIDATPILLILMIEPLALSFFGPGGPYISYSDRKHIMLPLSIFAIVLFCISITVGAWLGGLAGAAWGSSLSWLCWSAILAHLSRKTSGYGMTLISSSTYGGAN